MNNFKELATELNHEIKNFKDYQRESIEAVNARADVLENEILNMKTVGLGMPGTGTPDAKMRKDFSDALRYFALNGDDSKLRNIGNIKNSMSVSSDPDGGYFVVPFLDQELVKTAKDMSSIREISRVVEISTDEYETVIDRSDAGVAWVGEVASRDATTTPTLDKKIIPCHEQYALLTATQKLVSDARIDLSAWLSEKGATAMAIAENTAFVSGTGILQPRGFLDYDKSTAVDASRDWDTLQYIATGASGAFKYTDSPQAPGDCLFDLIYNLKSQYRKGAYFVLNSLTAGECRKLKDAQGRYLWTDSLISGQPNLLAGFPVQVCEAMPDISADSYSVAFGNFFAGFTIVDRHGIRLIRDNLTSKPNILFYMYRRVGSAITNSEAIKLLKFGTS